MRGRVGRALRWECMQSETRWPREDVECAAGSSVPRQQNGFQKSSKAYDILFPVGFLVVARENRCTSVTSLLARNPKVNSEICTRDCNVTQQDVKYVPH